MARTRTLTLLRDDVRKRADIESATDRHPNADLTRYINQGIAELYDLLIDARGAAYYRATPTTITTTGGSTTRYALNAAFYRLISVRSREQGQYRLVPFTAEDEPWLREESNTVVDPTHYQIQPGYIELLPAHAASRRIIVDYVPHMTDLSGDSDTFDGINGWEDYVVAYAARKVAAKDEEQWLVGDIDRELANLRQRIQRLAPKRDMGRAERVKDVRGGNWALRWRS